MQLLSYTKFNFVDFSLSRHHADSNDNMDRKLYNLFSAHYNSLTIRLHYNSIRFQVKMIMFILFMVN